MIRLERVLGGAALVFVLVGCGGGTGASPDGGAGRGGAGTGGVAINKGSGGGGGASGAAGAAGTGAATGGAAGTSANTGGVAGTGAGAGGSIGAGGAIGAGGTAGSGAGGAAGSGPGGAAGAGTGGHPAGGVGGGNCRPDILIVQDRSGSMNNDDNDQSCTSGGCGANSKWSQVTAAITNVVGANDGKVNWGIKYFPDNTLCDASNAPTVGIAAGNGAAVAASLTATKPGGNTPTRDAITFGAAYLAALTDSNPKYLLLATDGLPSCPAGCAAMTTSSTMCTMTDNPTEDLAAETAVMMAATQGFKTFVIGIGNVATAQNTLNQLALAGGEPQPGAATDYYAATDEAAFELALNRIVSTIAGCPP
jgi:hypothetical protein